MEKLENKLNEMGTLNRKQKKRNKLDRPLFSLNDRWGRVSLCKAGVGASLHFHELTSAQHHGVCLGNEHLKCWERGGT